MKIPLGSLLAEAARRWSVHRGPRLGAAVAFYAVFSLAPLLLIVIAVASSLLGDHTVPDLVSNMEVVVGPVAAHSIASMLVSEHAFGHGALTAAIAMATVLFGAAGVFGELQDALNDIWDVPATTSGWLAMLRARLWQFAVVALSALILLASLGLTVGITAASTFFAAQLPLPGWVLEAVNSLVSFGVVTLLLAMIFRILPDKEVAWKDVWFGASLSALLFTLGKWALGLYLGRSSVSSAYGAAGSLIVLLLFVYYTAQIILFGAEFSAVHADRRVARTDQPPAAPGERTAQPPLGVKQERSTSY